jgi:hypothetical protein
MNIDAGLMDIKNLSSMDVCLYPQIPQYPWIIPLANIHTDIEWTRILGTGVVISTGTCTHIVLINTSDYFL